MSVHGRQLVGCRRKAPGATSALVASTRAADGRYCPGRGLSPLLRKFHADAQGEEGGRPRRVRGPTGTEDRQDSGCRPAPLEEVTEPQWEAVTAGYVAAQMPLFSSPMLADTAAESVDARTVKYLHKAALRRGRSGRWSWRGGTSSSGVLQRLWRRRARFWS